MRFRHRIDGEERLARRLAELAELPGLDRALDGAAGRLRDELAEGLAEAHGPLAPGEAEIEVEARGRFRRGVALVGRRAFEAEFGARRRGPASTVSRAVRAASGAVRRALRQGAQAALRAATSPGETSR